MKQTAREINIYQITVYSLHEQLCFFTVSNHT